MTQSRKVGLVPGQYSRIMMARREVRKRRAQQAFQKRLGIPSSFFELRMLQLFGSRVVLSSVRRPMISHRTHTAPQNIRKMYGMHDLGRDMDNLIEGS